MTLTDIAFIELVILGLVVIAQHELEIPVQLADALLPTARDEAFTVYAQGLAGAAGGAVRTIDVVATAPESCRQQPFVPGGVEQFMVHQDQQLLLLVTEVAASGAWGQPDLEDHFFTHRLILLGCQHPSCNGCRVRVARVVRKRCLGHS